MTHSDKKRTEAFWKFYREERKRVKRRCWDSDTDYSDLLYNRRYRVAWILAIPFWILSIANIAFSGYDWRLCAIIYTSYCIFALVAFLTYEGHINKPTKRQYIEHRIYLSRRERKKAKARR